MTSFNQEAPPSNYLEKFSVNIKKFVKLEAAAGILLMLAMLAAMLIKKLLLCRLLSILSHAGRRDLNRRAQY